MSRTAQIDVDEISHGLYDVVVDSFTTARSFRVTLNDETYEYLGQSASRRRTREEFIRDSFRFLLEREPKESILEEFNIEDIKKYYPEFEDKILGG